MKKLVSLLQSPYPALCQRWKTVVISSVIVFLIISFLQPFGISQMHRAHKVFILLGYGVVSSLSLSITIYLMPALFPKYFEEKNWTLGKHLLNTLAVCFLITIGNGLYSAWVYDLALSWNLFYISLVWVALLAPFPIVFFTMWNRNLQLARNLREATEMNFHLSKKMSLANKKVAADDNESSLEILVFSGGAKEMLEVAVDDFLYAEAEGNYVKVTYWKDKEEKAVQKLLRVTMKQIEETVAAHTFIVRCHRAFLVNVRQVMKVDGNSQGYRLQLDGCADEVPVSRAYAKEVKMLIENKLQR